MKEMNDKKALGLQLLGNRYFQELATQSFNITF